MNWPVDAEGLASTMNSSFATYCGYIFGLMLIKYKHQEWKFIIFGLTFSALSYYLVNPVSQIIPISKTLNTASFLCFILFTSSGFLTLFFLLADYLPKRNISIIPSLISKPLKWMGTNSLIIFILVGVVFIIGFQRYKRNGYAYYTYYYQQLFSKWIAPEAGSILYALLYEFGYLLVVGLMYKFKIFLVL